MGWAFFRCMRMNSSAKTQYKILPLVLCGASLLWIGCGSGEPANIKTAETEGTKKAIESYEASGTDAAKAKVDRAFAELDQEIKELEVRVANTTGEARAEANSKLTELKERKNELKVDFTEAKFSTLMEDIKKSVR